MYYKCLFDKFNLSYENYLLLDSILFLDNFKMVSIKNNTILFADENYNMISINKVGNSFIVDSSIGVVFSNYLFDFDNKNYLAYYCYDKGDVAIQDTKSLKIFELNENSHNIFTFKKEINNGELCDIMSYDKDDPGYYLNLGKIYFLSQFEFEKTLK